MVDTLSNGPGKVPNGLMRLLFLSKRRPQARDLLRRPYGRFFNIPRELVARGHAAHLLLIDYESAADEHAEVAGLRISSIGLRRNPFITWSKALAIANDVAPDWIVGCSDIWFGILAARLARQLGTRYAIDAYDNYESYIPWALPAHWLWHRAIANADLVTAAGGPLLKHMTRRGCRGAKAVIPMAADPIFIPRDRNTCRRALGLPINHTLIGYAGSLHPSRDTRLLLQLMHEFEARRPDIRFVLCGRRFETFELPSNSLHLGYLPDHQVPLMLSSMNVVLSLNRESEFGHHSYPSKIYEAAAAGVPFVATSTLATRSVADTMTGILVPAGEIDKLAAALTKAISIMPTAAPPPKPWSAVSIELEERLL